MALAHLRGVVQKRASWAVMALTCFPLLTTTGWTALEAPAATSNSITLTWTAPGDDGSSGTASIYDIRYSTSAITAGNWNSATTVVGEPSPQLAGSSESFTVTGLQPATTYYFAIKVGDEVPNWSPLSNVVSKATDQETDPPAVIANLTLSNPTETSLQLNWTAPGDDGNTGTASTYDIRYSTSPINAGNFASATAATGEPSPSSAGSNETFILNGLSPATTYYVAMRTADDVPNWSGISNVASAATADETIPPATITTLAAITSNESSVTLRWTAVGDDGMSGTASEYDIRYSTSPITAGSFGSATAVTNEPSPQASGQTETFIVTGLNASQTYYFAMRVADDVPNWSSVSNTVSRATSSETTPPSAIADVAVTDANETSIIVSWTAVGDDGTTGTASSYDIRYSTSPITGGNWSGATVVANPPTPQTAGSSESVVITGLTPQTTYYVAIKVSDEVPNESPLSNVAQGATTGDITPPSPINDLSASTGAFEGELILSWTSPGDDQMAGQATAYEVRYAQWPITTGTFESASLLTSPPAPFPGGMTQAYVMTGLVPADTYWTAIRSYDEMGNASPISNISWGIASFDISLDNDDDAVIALDNPHARFASARPELRVTGPLSNAGGQLQIEIATDSSFFGVVSSGVAIWPSDTLLIWRGDDRLETNQDYYWRARLDGGSYSNIGTFTVVGGVQAYPTQFRPGSDPNVRWVDLPSRSDLQLVSVSGETIREWRSLNTNEVIWDGTNTSGERVASGVYLWFVPSTGDRGKLVVIN